VSFRKFSLRKHAMISGGLFLLMLVMGWGGAALQASGAWPHPERLQTPMKIIFFTIFIVFAFSLIPTMVKAFLAGQASIGNADKTFIRLIDRHQVGVIWGFWILWIAGFAVALPTMIQTGFFTNLGGSDTASNGDDTIARQIARTPVQGTLVSAPGMKVEEMIRGSSLKINQQSNSAVPSEPLYSGGAIFNFRVAGTGIEFPRCRYYFVTTLTSDRSRIESINVGTASAKMTRAQLDAANAALRARLKADGWLTGHEVYRDEEDRQLHGGKTRGEEGKLWLKGDITLDIERRRLDDPKPDEDSATAGEWIQYVDLFTRKDYPWIERYEFAPPQK
jgi:hypothetical protein